MLWVHVAGCRSLFRTSVIGRRTRRTLRFFLIFEFFSWFSAEILLRISVKVFLEFSFRISIEIFFELLLEFATTFASKFLAIASLTLTAEASAFSRILTIEATTFSAFAIFALTVASERRLAIAVAILLIAYSFASATRTGSTFFTLWFEFFSFIIATESFIFSVEQLILRN